MRRTLIICDKYPLPENIGTDMRTMNFVRFFQGYGPIDIAYTSVLTDSAIGHSIFANEYLVRTHSSGNFKARFIRGLVNGVPWPISEFPDGSRQLLSLIIETNAYDWILARGVAHTSCLCQLPTRSRQRTIVDFDDIASGSLYGALVGSVQGRPRKFLLQLNRHLLKRYEQRCLRFGASLFCSPQDRFKIVGSRGNRPAFVVPNIYDDEHPERLAVADGVENGNTLLFVGTLSYGPNIQGLGWFIETIFSEFRKIYPDAKLLVVGRLARQEVRDLCRRSAAIALHEDAPDVSRYYMQCRVVVVPLLSGGGTRIKILEAALAGRPVLSTPIGAEGLSLVDGSELLLFRNAAEFLAGYDMLKQEERYRSVTHSARIRVLSEYSRDVFNNAMVKVLQHLDTCEARAHGTPDLSGEGARGEGA